MSSPGLKIVLLATVAIAGCQRQVAPPPAMEASTPWVEIHREGGLAGMQTTLTLHSNGTFGLATRRGCSVEPCIPTDSTTGVLPADSLAAIRSAADALPDASFRVFGASPGWADQYLYDITLVRGDSTVRAEGDDGSLPKPIRDWNTRVFAMINAARSR